MALFKNQQRPTLTPRAALEGKYAASRANLLLVMGITLLNLILLLCGGEYYFLFSAYIPYYALILGMLYCGKFPPEYYEGAEDFVQLDDSFLVVTIVFAVFVTLLYLLAWLCSKGHKVGWLIFALVLFSLDTAALIFIGGFEISMIIDLLFHVWVLYYLVLGVTSHYKLKKLPPEEPVQAMPVEELPPAEETTEN